MSKLATQNQNYKQFYEFSDKDKLVRALSTKIASLEYQQKNQKPYKYGHNEELIGMGQQLLEFFFFDYMILKGYPNPATQIKKTSDIILMRQKLLSEKNIGDLASKLNLSSFIQVGNQKQLQNNPKILAEALKSILAAHYIDKEYDLDQMREIISPIITMLLEKSQHMDLKDLRFNSKSQFYEYLNQIQEYKLRPKIAVEWEKQQNKDGTIKQQFIYTLEIENVLEIKQIGENKRLTEQYLFKKALQRLKLWNIQDQSNSIISENDKIQDQSIILDRMLNDQTFIVDQSTTQICIEQYSNQTYNNKSYVDNSILLNDEQKDLQSQTTINTLNHNIKEPEIENSFTDQNSQNWTQFSNINQHKDHINIDNFIADILNQ